MFCRFLLELYSYMYIRNLVCWHCVMMMTHESVRIWTLFASLFHRYAPCWSGICLRTRWPPFLGLLKQEIRSIWEYLWAVLVRNALHELGIVD